MVTQHNSEVKHNAKINNGSYVGSKILNDSLCVLYTLLEQLTMDNIKDITKQSLQVIAQSLNLEAILLISPGEHDKHAALYCNAEFKGINYLESNLKDKNLHCPYFNNQITKGLSLKISSPVELPKQASTEKHILENTGLDSLILIPVDTALNKRFGIVAFSQSEKIWDENVMASLKFFGRLLAFRLDLIMQLSEVTKSEIKFKALADFSHDLEYWLLPDYNLEYISPSCEQIVGYSQDELYEHPGLLKEIVHPDDLARWEDHMKFDSSQNELPKIVFRIIKKDGTICWISKTVKQLLDNEGNFIGWRNTDRDITYRITAEEGLKKALLEVQKLKEELEIENLSLKKEIQHANDFPEIISKNPIMLNVFQLVKKVAPTNSPVLITGETGTGKELIARAVHARSNRSKRSMVTVNCAAIPAALIESELFGREKGAYTGALTKQVGLFQMANNSTIFLDEIGDLPFETQSKLLRILQFGEFQMLGSPITHKVDVRIVAATNKNILELIKNGEFREDLYYRLNVFPLGLPPLRQRLEDIPLLVRAFAIEFSQKIGKRIDTISSRSMEKLHLYNWPGNLRELRNVVEYSTILSDSKKLNIQFHRAQSTEQEKGTTLEEIEREHIRQILKLTKGKVSGNNGAAKLLGLKESTLRFRMKKLEIEK